MKVLHIVPSLNVETGGPARSVSRLADAQASAGLDVTVLALDYPRHGRALIPSRANCELIDAHALARFARGWSLAFARRAQALAASHDLVHNHGLWMQVNRFARLAAVAAGKPLVCSPRGMLEPYSRQRSAFRKRLAMLAFEARNLSAVRLFHATADNEAAAIRAVLPNAEIAVLPNIVEPLTYQPASDQQPLQLLFLGRLDQKKGLDWLIQAWQERAPRTVAWHLHIAGPCGLGFETELRQLQASTAGDPSVHWLGPLDGAAKASALQDSAALVLPSRSENFGNVIPEAMWTGRPVLTTDATPWSVLASEGMGWSVPASQAGVKAGLDAVLSSTASARAAMGQRARHYAEQHLAESAIGQQWQQVYAYVLGRTAAPECLATRS